MSGPRILAVLPTDDGMVTISHDHGRLLARPDCLRLRRAGETFELDIFTSPGGRIKPHRVGTYFKKIGPGIAGQLALLVGGVTGSAEPHPESRGWKPGTFEVGGGCVVGILRGSWGIFELENSYRGWCVVFLESGTISERCTSRVKAQRLVHAQQERAMAA